MVTCVRCRRLVRTMGPVLLPHRCVTRASPIAEASLPAQVSRFGIGQDWAPTAYGEYYAKSAPVYAAVKLRADSVTRAPVRVYRQGADGEEEETPDHPLQSILDRVNPFWTGSDLWRITSMYLDLWGSAYWVLDRSSESSPPKEIWPARPDHVRVMASARNYIEGYIYQGETKRQDLFPWQVVRFRNLNPMSEFAGLAPMAALRLSADMGQEALRYNREAFRNGVLIDNIAFTSEQVVTDTQVEEFLERVKQRYSGAGNAHKPIVTGEGLKPVNLGISQKDMEYMASLRWTLEDVSRVYGVPMPLLSDLTHSTYANVDAAERMFWRNTIVPYLRQLESTVNEFLSPMFGDGVAMRFDLSEIEALQENVNEVALRDREDVKTGILTINEVRADRGLEPVDWGDSQWAPPSIPFGLPEMDGFEASQARSLGPGLTEGFLERFGAEYVRALDRHERRFLNLQRNLFDRQRKDTLGHLPEARALIRQFPDDLFNVEEWVQLFKRLGKPLILAALVAEAERQASVFKLPVVFDPDRRATQEWVEARTAFWAGRVNEETARLLAQEVAAAHDAGESIKELQARVEKVFKFSNIVRSEMIARTEMNSATNAGALDAYEQSKVVGEKMWVAALDERTRDAHREAHRQQVPLEADFIVGGEALSGPGDMRGSAENVINCRCTVAPVARQRGFTRQAEPLPKPQEPKEERQPIIVNVHMPQTETPKRVRKTITRSEDGWPIAVVEEHE